MEINEIRAKQNTKLAQLKKDAEIKLARKFGTKITKTHDGYAVSGYEWRGNFYPVAIVPVNPLSEAIRQWL